MRSGMRVLLADDETLNRRITAAALTRAGMVVVAVADGGAAVEAAAAEAFDLILLDVQMPGTDGPAAARAIRAGAGRRVPIIALSASALDADVAACRAAGMDAFLVKPLRMEALAAAMSGLAATPSAPAEAGLLDRERLALLAEELPDTLLRASLQACLASLRQSAAALDAAEGADAVAAVAHKIAGTAATYGLAALAGAALDAEAAAKQRAAGQDAALERLRALLPPSRAALQSYAAGL